MNPRDVKAAMRTLAATPDDAVALPASDLLWRRAAARERYRQYELATRSIRVAEWIAFVVCVVTGLVSLLVMRNAIGEALGTMSASFIFVGAMAIATTLLAVTLVKTLLSGE